MNNNLISSSFFFNISFIVIPRLKRTWNRVKRESERENPVETLALKVWEILFVASDYDVNLKFSTRIVSLRSSARVLAIVRRNFWFPNDRNPIERDSRARFRWEEEGKIVRIKVWNTRNTIKRVESTYIYIYSSF